MGQARKKYTQAYKDEAVELVVSSGRPIAEIARDLGINEAALGGWVSKAKDSGICAPVGLSRRSRRQRRGKEPLRRAPQRFWHASGRDTPVVVPHARNPLRAFGNAIFRSGLDAYVIEGETDL